ncbi:MAG: hypothetical protein A2V84_09565 [Chloroflexi bacterium RBG_16_70_13]|nr:MAG: hypothetical protein A2V84_09565 [Chloroflexi bacterium RBG_16_70_13]
MSQLIVLYPRAWRARYGEELKDIAAAGPLGIGGSIDLVRGALDAHRHPELVDPSVAPPTGLEPVSPQRLADLRVARRLGIASWLGAVAWIFAWVVAANGPMVGSGVDAYRDGAAAFPIYFAALVMLSAGLIGQMIRLPGRARAARLGAFIGIFAAPLWGLGPWLLVFALVLLLALLLLAVGAWWVGEWSGPTAFTVVAVTVIGSSIMVSVLGGGASRPIGEVLMVLFVSLLTVNWLAIGANLQVLPSVIEGIAGGEATTAETAPA